MAWEIKDKNLSNKFHELGLVEDDLGYWYYPPYSKDFWIISSFGDSISMAVGFAFERGRVKDVGISNVKIKVSDADLILKKVKDLIDEFHNCMLQYKQEQEQKRLENLKDDFNG